GWAARAVDGDDAGRAAAGAVRGRDADRSHVGRCEGGETVQLRIVGAAKHGDSWCAQDLSVPPGERAAAGNDIGAAIAVDIAGRHIAAAGEVNVEGEEVSDLRAVLAAEHDDVRAATRPGGANDIRSPVAIDVADRHAHAAGESGVESEEAGEEGAVGSKH